MKSLEFRIRKLHVNTDVEKRLQKRQPSRLYVSEEALLELTGSKDGGKAVCIEKRAPSTSRDEPPVRREATLWKAPEKLDKSVTQMYDGFRDACGYQLGEHVKITVLGGSIPDADGIVLEETPLKDIPKGQTAPPQPPEPIEEGDIPHWEFFLAGRLSMLEHVHTGMVFKNIFVRGPERTFTVVSVNGKPTGNARYLDRRTAVRISQTASEAEKTNTIAPGKLKVSGIRGLDVPIKKLNDILSSFSAREIVRKGQASPNIVIHGGHGTGKTMLLNKIAATGWGTVFRIQFKEKLSEIQEIFQRARLQQPSIILMDQFEKLVDKDRNNRNAVITAICEALDILATEARIKTAAPRVLVVAACLDYTIDIPEELKEPRRFPYEVYLPLPDAQGRKEILASFDLSLDPSDEPEVLRQLSERTHAYNGKDLMRLFDQGRLLASIRDAELTGGTYSPSPPNQTCNETPREAAAELHDSLSTPAYCTPADYMAALKLVRPSAMHDINLKPPPIRWSDIGGQSSVKLSLRRAIRLSTESPTLLSRFFDRPPKGFLLYGPPGCSKTMAAQAMATESGLNFFAVKGAELLNMYVGESERAVRRLFQRAREVAPSMIFFDEIDSIAGQRHGFGHKGSSSSGSTHGGVNVLTTLLNEMDGFEALQGVVVLAATNRPQALDPALLRPGRFDELIYVSPPDLEARRAIFAGVVAKREMHADVDIDALAEKTEGYSGAEIKGICAAAGMAAYDRHSAEETFPDHGDQGAKEPRIRMRDLENAIRNQKKQITEDMIRGFEEWEQQFKKH